MIPIGCRRVSRRAKPWFRRALEADPTAYAAAYRLALCEREADETEASLAHLLLAQANAPLVADITSAAARALTEAGRTAEARRMLAPFRARAHAAPGSAPQ